MTKQTVVEKDLPNKRLTVTRYFEAPAAKVWQAWTNSALLDKWWAPRPWHTETQRMDFTDGGYWFYCMAGPGGERHYCIANYKEIEPGKSFKAIDAFCDEQGTPTTGAPSMHWYTSFQAEGEGTNVYVEVTFNTIEELNTIVEMGFAGGFTMAHGNLDELLAEGFK